MYKDLKFYYFLENRWIEDIENASIFKCITKSFIKDVEDYINNNGDDEEKKILAFKLISKIKGKLANYRGILEWIGNELLDSQFYDLCDNNIFLLGFNNGVYDTRDKTFRNGKPSDYITKTTGYDLPTTDKGYKQEIDDF